MLPDSNTLADALRWIARVMTGSMATSIATLLVGVVGLSVMSGRLRAKRAFAVIVGCFILFSASTVASGLMFLVERPQDVAVVEEAAPDYAPVIPKAVSNDPYNGATVAHGIGGSDAPAIR